MRSRCTSPVAVAAFAVSIVLAAPSAAQTTPAVPPSAEPETILALEPGFDLSTPRRALASFLAAARTGDWEQAARVLDMRELPRDQRDVQGDQLARDLAALLDASGVEPASLPDEAEPAGEPAVLVMRAPGAVLPVVMRRIDHEGERMWKFAPETVRAIPGLLASLDRGPIGSRMPRELVTWRAGGLEAWQWAGLPIALLIALLLGSISGRFATWVVHRVVREPRRSSWERALERARAPVRVTFGLAYLGLFAVLLRLPSQAWEVVGRVYLVAWLLAIGWLFVRLVDVLAERVGDRAAAEVGWRARETRTRVIVLRRVMNVVGILIVIAAVLLQFDPVREVGFSLLASAGVAGIVVGLAAQRTLGNLLAGIQLSFTQPLRVGDEVVIEGEFGTVEEINLSYVVIAVWDERRLIIPMTRLLETPFQNWTRAKTDLVGSVVIQVDFSTPFDRVRAEVEPFVRAHPLFDGRVVGVQVVDSSDRTASLRVLASAADAGSTWDLRCAIREFVITLLQRLDRGRHLPRVRVDEEPDAHGRAAAAE